ncbi:MAG: type VI secretion lipoprotein TssJ, partial [Planctomycetes bacterium]|nr:type VI secretion lipoprotein TssJ [Planctomycetota bacterium]
PRELREARATAMAEADIYFRGGRTYVRPDGSSSRPSEVKFVAAPGALGIDLAASDSLNAVDGIPTGLVLIIYHLSDRVALDRLAAASDGMATLLAGDFFDPSVRAVRRIDVQPGLRNRLALERAEDGRYVAIVAGYNQPREATSLAVFTYPIAEYSEPGETSWHRSKSMFMPLPLNLSIRLDDNAMYVSEIASVYHHYRDSTRLYRRQPSFHHELAAPRFRR